jgi:hypothetical protein
MTAGAGRTTLAPSSLRRSFKAMSPAAKMRNALIVATVTAGIALRFARFLENPPLGLDEARLALNIAIRSYGELLQPLDHDQSAPLLYLWIQRAAVALFGVHEPTLRLLPLACGVGLVLLTPSTLGRLLSARATIVATLVVAFSPLLIYYSSNVKQYGVEACLTLLVLRLALRCREASYSVGTAAPLTVLGTLLPWLAAPGVFVLSGLASCALADFGRGTARARLFLLRSVPVWAVSFVLAYLITYKPASRNPYLRHYWKSALLNPGQDGFIQRLWALLNENLWGLALGYPGPPGRHLPNLAFLTVAVTLLMVLVAGGRWLLKRHGWSILVLVVGPPVIAIGASVLGIYPLSLRLTLFAAPLVQLVLIAGLHRVMMPLPDAHAARAWVLTGSALALPLLAISLLQARWGSSPEDIRTLVKELSRQRRHEPVYVFAGSIPPWLYYSTDWNAPDLRRLEFVARVASAGGAAFENAPSRNRVGRSEGEGLEYRTPAGLELYGLATGIEWTPSLGPVKLSPDAGWVENETQRIESLGAGAVWVLMSRTMSSERELQWELERRGASATYHRELDNAMLVRYLLPHQPPL